MDIRQLQQFLSIVHSGSYIRAAEAMGISQSALTQSMARLEQSVGACLLDRGRFGATPTAAGRILAERAQRILLEKRLAEIDIAAVCSGAEGRLTIGMDKTSCASVMPAAMRRFLARGAKVEVTLVEGLAEELLCLVMRGDVDAMIGAHRPPVELDPELATEMLGYEVDDVVIGPLHPSYDAPQVGLAQLANCCWLVGPRGYAQESKIAEVFIANQLDPPSQIICNGSPRFARAMLATAPVVAIATLGLQSAATPLRVIEDTGLRYVRHLMIVTRRRMRPEAVLTQFLHDTRTAWREQGGAELPPDAVDPKVRPLRDTERRA